MNREQIAQIYDEFPEDKRDIPREQFIRKVANALDPNKMAAEADIIVQRRITGRMNKAAIDEVVKRND